MTPATATTQVGTIDTSWFQAVSYGQFGGWNATAVNWQQIPTPPMDTARACGNAFRSTIQSEGDQAARDQGYDLGSY